MLEIPDKILEDGTVVTDGCAFVRRSWAREIFEELGLSEETSGKNRPLSKNHVS